MARFYSAKFPSRRWPLFLWGNILDIEAINACILCTKLTCIRVSRKNFILKLIESLLLQPLENGADDNSSDMIELVDLQRKRKNATEVVVKMPLSFMCHHCKTPACGKCLQANSKLVFDKCNSCG